ncbi:hypothetical protein Tco_1090139 [Tanacetum coccineum]|uniref:Uncharacterized protein n=1 Tax=Tanacetum coccineum TaxID=301880 RepID=A0ABQ5I3B0_9ASTR
MQTKTKLTLKQTQQGVSDEVLEFISQTDEFIITEGQIFGKTSMVHMDDFCIDEDQHGSVQSIGVAINGDVADFGSKVPDSGRYETGLDIVGPALQALLRLDLVPNQVIEMISCTNENKLLALLLGYNFLSSTMGTIDSMKSVLTQSALNALCEKFHIPDVVHPNFLIPLSQFLVDILEYFQINLSQLSVIAAAKVSHFEILCRVYGFVPTVEMDLFAFINHADPTKGNANVYGAGNDDVNEEGNDAVEADQTDQGDHVVDVGGIDIVADDEVQAIVDDKPQRVRKKRKAADGASASGLPPKKLREDYGTSGIGASNGVKSVSALQSLLEGSTLAVEVGVTATATVPFVTSSVTPTPEREGPADSIFETGLRTQHPAKRFVISSDSSHDSNANDADDEVTSIVRSSVPPPPVLTVVVATTIVAGAMSALVHESGTGPVPPSIFRDSASPSTAEANVVGPSQPAGEELCSMDYEQLFAEFNVGAARQTCLGAEVRMRLCHTPSVAETQDATIPFIAQDTRSYTL